MIVRGRWLIDRKAVVLGDDVYGRTRGGLGKYAKHISWIEDDREDFLHPGHCPLCPFHESHDHAVLSCSAETNSLVSSPGRGTFPRHLLGLGGADLELLVHIRAWGSGDMAHGSTQNMLLDLLRHGVCGFDRTVLHVFPARTP